MDYRGLHRINKNDHYLLLPLPISSIDFALHACSFTRVVLCSTYDLVRIADGDKWETAFRSRYGSSEFLAMLYGPTNAPTPFQRFMNDVFMEPLDICIFIYLGDILVYSENPTIHTAHVLEILS